MRAKTTLWIPLALAGLLLAPSVASAQNPSKMQVKLKAAFGIGGEVEAESNLTVGKTTDDLETTFGFVGQFEYPLHRFFMVGASVGIHSWLTEPQDNANLDRSLALDIDIVAKGRIPIMGSKAEIYANFFVGPTIFFPDKDLGAPNNDVKSGVGYNLGILAGFQWHFTSLLGAFLELGWTHRGVRYTFEPRVAGLADIDVEGNSDQFQLNLGVNIAF